MLGVLTAGAALLGELAQERSMMRRTIQIASIAAVGILPVTGEPKADVKRFPGSVCVRTGGSNIVAYNFSAIGNPDPLSALYLECPVTKDTGHIHTSGNHFVAKDRSPSANVQCTLMSVNRGRFGAITGWWSQVGSTRADNDTWQVVETNQTSSGNNQYGVYYFSCMLPPKATGISFVSMFRIDERS